MKLPLSWLVDHVDLAATSVGRPDGSVDVASGEGRVDVDALVDVMSLNGLEVEEVTTPGAGTVGVRTARVLDWAPHPDADKLRVAHVTGEGGEGSIELVCGASNFDVGDVVVHAFPGSSIPSGAGPGGPVGMTMAAKELRGVVSHGMLASARELELGDDHEGILVLPSDTPLGVPITDLLPLGDPVIEIAVQPDRGDHLSILGVARDLAAILDTTWSAPDVPDAPTTPGVPVTLDADDGCARFVAWTLEDVRLQPSPPWLRQRLAQCGVRSIDVVVDVTNLVMLELGQPLHAFDLDRIAGPQLTVRRAGAGESLTTLDDAERTLVDGDLVIDDADGPASLAGVMGGLRTEVHAGTTRVLLEGALWDPTAIRATSRRLGLVSEASQRFERRVDPAGVQRAVARAAGLLAELADARVVAATDVTADTSPAYVAPATVRVDTERVRRLTGVDALDGPRQAQLLERAGATVDAEGDTYVVTAPSWRGDLRRPADVAEEVARLHGYEAIPAELPALPTTGGLTAVQATERDVRRVALAHGFHEAVTRPFVGDDALLGVLPTEGRVALANPLAQDAAAMRPTLLEGLLQALRRNRGQGRVGTALVELGRIFRPAGDALEAALTAGGETWRWTSPQGDPLPTQPRTVAFAAEGLRAGPGWLDPDARWEVTDVLAAVVDVLDRLLPAGAPPVARQATTRDRFHPGRTVALTWRGAEVGVVGELHPDEADARDLPGPVVVAELVLEPFLQQLATDGVAPVQAVGLVKHPAMTVDVALVADDDVPYATLERLVRDAVGDLLDDLWWFDEYRGEQVGPGRRSVALRLRLQAPDRQLTDADAEQVLAAVTAAAADAGVTLRA